MCSLHFSLTLLINYTQDNSFYPTYRLYNISRAVEPPRM